MITNKSNEIDMVDRVIDRQALRSFCKADNTDSRCLLVRTQTASGISHFLQYYQSITDKGKNISVYADLTYATRDDIINLFFKKSKRKILSLISNIFTKETVVGILKVITNYFCGAGAIVKAGADAISSVSCTLYESESLEKFAKKVFFLRKNTILFFFDNAQFDFSKIEGLLKLTHSNRYKNVKFIIAHINDCSRCDDYDVFKGRIIHTCKHKIDELNFSGVTKELLNALVKNKNIDLQESEYDNILNISHRKIWTLLKIIGYSHKHEYELSLIEKHILKILILSKQGIRKSDLWEISISKSLVYIESKSQWETSLKNLLVYRLISFDNSVDSVISLAANTHPEIVALSSYDPKDFSIICIIYEYFDNLNRFDKEKRLESYTIPILYRLSGSIGKKRPFFAQQLVAISMKSGSLKYAEKYINTAIQEVNLSEHDYFIQLSFFVASLQFEKAMAIIDGLPDSIFSDYKTLRIIRAVTLNRVRKHDESLKALQELFNEPSSDDEKALYSSYKISGLLHEGREEEAALYAKKMEKKLKLTKGYGYFLRNAFSSFMWRKTKDLEKATDFLKKSREHMQSSNDYYGEATVICNMGVVECYKGNMDKGFSLFNESFSKLKIYGTHHIPQVGVNIGIVLTKIGKYKDAINWLDDFCLSLDWGFPRFLGSNSLALAKYMTGKEEEAMRICEKNYDSRYSIKIDEVKSRAIFNFILLNSAINGFSKKTLGMYKELKQKNWFQPTTIQTLKIILRNNLLTRNHIRDAWSYDYCQYWSNNPFTMIPDNFVSF